MKRWKLQECHCVASSCQEELVSSGLDPHVLYLVDSSSISNQTNISPLSIAFPINTPINIRNRLYLNKHLSVSPDRVKKRIEDSGRIPPPFISIAFPAYQRLEWRDIQGDGIDSSTLAHVIARDDGCMYVIRDKRSQVGDGLSL